MEILTSIILPATMGVFTIFSNPVNTEVVPVAGDAVSAVEVKTEEVVEVPELTEEEKAREERLSMWQEKQSYLNENLPKDVFTINASAYTASADECGKSDGITASGVKVKKNRTLACPPQYPFGTKININGYGIYTCEDRGGAIKGNKFDIYMETKGEAFAFGRRNLEAEVVF